MSSALTSSAAVSLVSQPQAAEATAAPSLPPQSPIEALTSEVAHITLSASTTAAPNSSGLTNERFALFASLYKPAIAEEFDRIPRYHYAVTPTEIIPRALALFGPRILQKSRLQDRRELTPSEFITRCTAMKIEELDALMREVPTQSIAEYLQPNKFFLPVFKQSTLDAQGRFISPETFISAFRVLIEHFPVGMHPDNHLRNRYQDNIPLEVTRVKLTSGAYINANHCGNKKLIICQGPLMDNWHNEQENFYQMLWDHDSTAVAMLTDYVEDDTLKCHRYLHPPANNGIIKWQVRNDSDFSLSDQGRAYLVQQGITLSDEDFKSLEKMGIKISEITLTKDGTSRTLLHFHLASWSDGTGGNALALSPLALVLLKMRIPVVHCSGGVGRAGTLAAIMIAYRKIEEYIGRNEPVPSDCIPTTVRELREEREQCVGTDKQYKTIYDTLKLMFCLPL